MLLILFLLIGPSDGFLMQSPLELSCDNQGANSFDTQARLPLCQTTDHRDPVTDKFLFSALRPESATQKNRCSPQLTFKINSRPVSLLAPLLVPALVFTQNLFLSPAMATPEQTQRLSESKEFQSLRREPKLPPGRQQIRDLQDLQDSRLEQCANRGVFWEQCFMFGESGSYLPKEKQDDRGGKLNIVYDNESLSPRDTLKRPESESVPSLRNVHSTGKRVSSAPPTW